MNNTHGDILHSPSTTSNRPSVNDLVYRTRPKDTTTGGVSSNQSYSNYQPPRGEVGWICPVCGRGLAPSTSYCPCNLTRNIIHLNGGVTIKDPLDNIIDCKSIPPEACCTTIATNSPNGEDWIQANAKLRHPTEVF
jgi:hypothetical protein